MPLPVTQHVTYSDSGKGKTDLLGPRGPGVDPETEDLIT